MKNYERPQILATYSVDELVKEAAVCHHYSWHKHGPPQNPGSKGKGKGKGK